MFDGPVTNLLSILWNFNRSPFTCSYEAVEKLKMISDLALPFVIFRVTNGKYGGESVKAHSYFPNTKCATARNYGSGQIYVSEC